MPVRFPRSTKIRQIGVDREPDRHSGTAPLYKVLFFVTEHGGRVAQQDSTTMKLVLDAAPEIGEKYGIIVNMVSKGVLKKLQTESMYHDFNNSMLAGIEEKNRCIYR